MAEYRLRHYGSFASVKGVIWRVEIMQRANATLNPLELTFEAEPLSIEWKETDVHEPLCGSSATLNIESPGDRTYVDLYTIRPGDIRMDVYRDGVLFWSGLLDPEFYEEPYEKADKYAVSLTFTDFGILDRLKFDNYNNGTLTLLSIVQDALNRAGILYRDLDYSTLSSTYFVEGDKADLASLSVRADNFIDEDGKRSTLKKAVEGVLLPLGLKMVQRAGVIHIYDLHGLYTNADEHEAVWSADCSTLGTGKVVNNVKIAFSAYGSGDNLLPELEYTGKHDIEDLDDADYIVSEHYYEVGFSAYNDDGGKSFALFTSEQSKGLEGIDFRARYFHMTPILSGSEHKGVLVYYRKGFGPIERKGHNYERNEALTEPLIGEGQLRGAGNDVPLCIYPILGTKSIYLPKLPNESAEKYLLRLNVPMLLDGRYNPLTIDSDRDDDLNDTKNHEKLEKKSQFVFVPMKVEMLDDNGTPIAHYYNSDIVRRWALGRLPSAREWALAHPSEGIWDEISTPGSAWHYVGTGRWRPGPAQYNDAWLAYYDVKDFEKTSAIGGWIDNCHCIGRPLKHFVKSESARYVFEYFKTIDQGEFIPYPMQGGHLRIEVYSGMRCSADAGKVWDATLTLPPVDEEYETLGAKTPYERIRWLGFEAPQLTIVRSSGNYATEGTDDVEYSGYINKDAEEELSIDTICGTPKAVSPTARGALMSADSEMQITKLTRAGITDHPERLLIGTIYSQYSERKNTLSGEIYSPEPGLHKFTEQNQGDRFFIITSEVMDCHGDVSEVKLTEFTPDEYIAIEEVED